MSKAKDLTGMKIGELLVIKKDIELSKEKGKPYWICQCSCGNIKSIRQDDLIKENKPTSSCGCARNKNACKKSYGIIKENDTFHKLTTIRIIGRTKHGDFLWLCKCECGGTCAVASGNLRSGNTKSCGCLTHSSNSVDKEDRRYNRQYKNGVD